jgi:hypothetical protein
MPINIFEDLSDDTWLLFLTKTHFAQSLKDSESKLPKPNHWRTIFYLFSFALTKYKMSQASITFVLE